MSLEQLVQDSQRHVTAKESSTLDDLVLSDAEAARVVAYLNAHPDESAYHALIALLRTRENDYRRIPASVRAEIFCAALRTQQFLNDFGYLHPTEPFDGESARALLETGDAARPCLARLLDDRDPAPLYGSEAATIAHMYRFRRRDFAYHYLSRILGSQPQFDPDPAVRDPLIDALKRRVVKG